MLLRCVIICFQNLVELLCLLILTISTIEDMSADLIYHVTVHLRALIVVVFSPRAL